MGQTNMHVTTQSHYTKPQKCEFIIFRQSVNHLQMLITKTLLLMKFYANYSTTQYFTVISPNAADILKHFLLIFPENRF